MVRRNVRAGFIGTALLVVVAACTQSNPTESTSCDEFGVGCSQDELQEQLQEIEGRLAAHAGGGGYTNVVNPQLLQCPGMSYAASAKIIGPGGGVLKFGGHKITVPPGALSYNVVVSGKLLVANHLVVELLPHGLQMSAPAILALDYDSCPSGGHGLEVAYVNNQLNVISYPDAPSGGVPSGQVRAELWHFSKYAVAY